MEYRRLTADDLASLLDLYRQLNADDSEGPAGQPEDVWREIESNANIAYFGAIDDGRVVSTCCAVCIPNLTRAQRGICFIENVVTAEEYRRRGLASRVMDMAIAFAKAHRCYKVILQSGVSRTGAHQFYQRKGFDGASKKAFEMRLD